MADELGKRSRRGEPSRSAIAGAQIVRATGELAGLRGNLHFVGFTDATGVGRGSYRGHLRYRASRGVLSEPLGHVEVPRPTSATRPVKVSWTVPTILPVRGLIVARPWNVVDPVRSPAKRFRRGT